MIDFNLAWNQALDCNVQLTQEEGKFLFNMAFKCGQTVVEVGSGMGGSTLLIAHAAQKIVTMEWDGGKAVTILANLGRFDGDLLSRVTILPFPDSAIWPLWGKGSRISLLVLDHDHTYIAMRNSLNGWKNHMIAGATILVHDYSDGFPEVKRAVNESGLYLKEVVGSFAACVAR